MKFQLALIALTMTVTTATRDALAVTPYLSDPVQVQVSILRAKAMTMAPAARTRNDPVIQRSLSRGCTMNLTSSAPAEKNGRGLRADQRSSSQASMTVLNGPTVQICGQ